MALALANAVQVSVAGPLTATTPSVTSTSGSAFHIYFYGNGVPDAPSDSKGNTWTQFGSSNTGGQRLTVYTATGATIGGAGHTVTITTAAADGFSVGFHEISGKSVVVDTAASAVNIDATSPFGLTSGPLAQEVSFAIAICGNAGGGVPHNFTEGSGFTASVGETNGSANWAYRSATKFTGSKAALATTWTDSPAWTDSVLSVLVFNETSGAANVKPVKRRRATSTFDYTAGGWFHAQVAAAGIFDKDLLYPASTGVYTLSVDPATYTLTAADETLSATRALSFDPAVYTLTAAAQTLSVGRAISFDPASYVLTAADQTLTATRALSIDSASYVLSAANITLSVGKNLSVDPASYVLTASDETLTATRALSIDPASYSLVAAAITLSAGRVLSVDAQTYTLTTSAETLTVGRALNIEPAAYVLSAAPVELTYTATGAVLSIDPASYVLDAAPVSFAYQQGSTALGGGPGLPRRRKGGTESYLQRLLGRPLDEYAPERIESVERAIEAAVETDAKAEQAPSQAEVASKFSTYAHDFRAAYVRTYLELVAQRREQLEEETVVALIARML